MLVPKMMVSWYFRPTLQQQNYGWRHYQSKLQFPSTKPTSPLYNRPVGLGLALMGAVHEHPKNCNFFSYAGAIFGPIFMGTRKNLMPDK